MFTRHDRVAVSQILPHGSIPITTICAAQLMITEIALAAPNGGPEPPVLRITLVACKRAAGRTLGGSARGYQAIFVASATLGSPGFDGQLGRDDRPAASVGQG